MREDFLHRDIDYISIQQNLLIESIIKNSLINDYYFSQSFDMIGEKLLNVLINLFFDTRMRAELSFKTIVVMSHICALVVY
jgi:hypothetical protein